MALDRCYPKQPIDLKKKRTIKINRWVKDFMDESPVPEAEMARTSPPVKALGEEDTFGTEVQDVPSGNTGDISCRYQTFPW